MQLFKCLFSPCISNNKFDSFRKQLEKKKSCLGSNHRTPASLCLGWNPDISNLKTSAATTTKPQNFSSDYYLGNDKPCHGDSIFVLFVPQSWKKLIWLVILVVPWPRYNLADGSTWWLSHATMVQVMQLRAKGGNKSPK